MAEPLPKTYFANRILIRRADRIRTAVITPELGLMKSWVALRQST